MDLSKYVDAVHRQFAAAAEAGGEEARALAERLFAPLESGLRLAFQDVLAAAAEEITTELAPGSVELRLRGREPEFVLTLPEPVGPSSAMADPVDPVVTGPDSEEGGVARFNLRLPEQLKTRVDQAAARQGISVNSWLVRAAAAVLERSEAPRPSETRRYVSGSQRYTGWSR
jgi:hypothetical protein